MLRDRQVDRQAVMRLLSVWVQYWPNTLLPPWRHQHSMCVCLASLRQATCPKHNAQVCVHGCVCLCACVIDLGGAMEVETQSCCLFSQTAKSMQSGFEWRQYTLLSSSAFVCVGDPARNPRRQSAVGHYSSNLSAATINDNVVVAVATNTLVPLHLHLEREGERGGNKREHMMRKGEKKSRKHRYSFYFTLVGVFCPSVASTPNMTLCTFPQSDTNVGKDLLLVCDINTMQLKLWPVQSSL